jgi:hypothetical protein
MFQLPSFRDAPGVCEDFLHEVYLFVSKMLRQQFTDSTFEKTPMECWITLPAIWSDEAKAATLIAAKNAGFGQKTNDEVFTIAEPEAAAIATLKKYAEPDALNPIKVILAPMYLMIGITEPFRKMKTFSYVIVAVGPLT